MRTWSLEGVIFGLGARAAVAAQGIIDAIWPPEYADRAEALNEEVPNPTEPGLTDDELVMTRQLIEERFGDQTIDSINAKTIEQLRGSLWCKKCARLVRDCPERCSTRAAATGPAAARPAEVCEPPRSPSAGQPILADRLRDALFYRDPCTSDLVFKFTEHRATYRDDAYLKELIPELIKMLAPQQVETGYDMGGSSIAEAVATFPQHTKQK